MTPLRHPEDELGYRRESQAKVAFTAVDQAGNIGEATKTTRPMADRIEQVCDEIKAMLLAKNAAYGNSAADPLRIFSKASPLEQINVRIDDKLSRITRGQDAGEDAELDLIGYLILKRSVKNL